MQEREARMRYDPAPSVHSPPRTSGYHSSYASPPGRRSPTGQRGSDYQQLSEVTFSFTLTFTLVMIFLITQL